MTTNRNGSRVTIPTVTDLLIQTSTSNCLHRWPLLGGSVILRREQLRPALEDAYDPTMPDWPAMVVIDDA